MLSEITPWIVGVAGALSAAWGGLATYKNARETERSNHQLDWERIVKTQAEELKRLAERQSESDAKTDSLRERVGRQDERIAHLESTNAGWRIWYAALVVGWAEARQSETPPPGPPVTTTPATAATR